MTARIGVDVGGTNTDAVAIEGRTVVARVKRPTSDDVLTGVVDAIRHLVTDGGVDAAAVEAVMIGTTHFTNAVVERRHLARTGVVRISTNATRAIPPMLDWPPEVRDAVEGQVHYLSGGHEFDGREIGPLLESEVAAAAASLARAGLHSVAVSGVFSPVRDEHEVRVAEILAREEPSLTVSRSTEIGRIGLVERENATILNAALRPLADRIVDAFETAMETIGLRCPLYLSQNDGTLMGAGHTRAYPVATFASGPTNSMRGAAYLSDITDCAVVDIGGTTTDIGILRHGFPREAPMTTDIGGIRTNFRMPDLVSVGIGGGSIVRVGDGVTVGPDSVGYHLPSEALVFGGDTLTATDVAVAAGMADVGDRSLVAGLDRDVVAAALAAITEHIADALDRMKSGPDPIPVVLVGGGAILVGERLPGASEIHRVEHADVANAIGAALAQVGGRSDRIHSMTGTTREAAVADARSEAVARCVESGARPESVVIVDFEEVPLAYLPSNAVRMTARAVGDLA